MSPAHLCIVLGVFTAMSIACVSLAQGTKGKKKIGKGIVYENLDDTAMESVDSTLLPNTQGLPSWRMEMKVEKGVLQYPLHSS